MTALFRKLVFAHMLVAASVGLVAAPTALAKPSAPYCAAQGGKDCDVELSRLPSEAQSVHGLIRQGGPFRYEKDGTVFGNREGLLPRERRGYYREYTVRTPGAANRGARRIVCGGRESKKPDACYYTADHYSSFRRIVTTN